MGNIKTSLKLQKHEVDLSDAAAVARCFEDEEGRSLLRRELRRKCIALINKLEGMVIERDELIRLMLLSIFAKRHIFLIGKPGVAKTLLIEILRNIFSDMRYWQLQLGHDTVKWELFGKIQYDDGKAIFDVDDTILGADFVFLDEMFKAKTEVLNSLLQVMNEGYYSEKGNLVKVPLNTIFSASNEIPEGRLIAPFKDRLPIWYEVQRIQNPQNFKRFIRKEFDRSSQFDERVGKHDIAVCTQLCQEVTIEEYLEDVFIALRDALLRAHIEISDRKLLWIMDILRTSAVMNGRKAVDISDFFLIKHMSWSNYLERKNAYIAIKHTLFGNLVIHEKELMHLLVQFERFQNSYKLRWKRTLDFMDDYESGDGISRFESMRHEISSAINDVQEIMDEASRQIACHAFTLEVENAIRANILVDNENIIRVYNDEMVEQMNLVLQSSTLYDKELRHFMDTVQTRGDYSVYRTSKFHRKEES